MYYKELKNSLKMIILSKRHYDFSLNTDSEIIKTRYQKNERNTKLFKLPNDIID